jgi:hypothetical protein
VHFLTLSGSHDLRPHHLAMHSQQSGMAENQTTVPSGHAVLRFTEQALMIG